MSIANDVTGLKESEEKLKQQQQESARRENILVMRLATKEQEMQECTVSISLSLSLSIPVQEHLYHRKRNQLQGDLNMSGCKRCKCKFINLVFYTKSCLTFYKAHIYNRATIQQMLQSLSCLFFLHPKACTVVSLFFFFLLPLKHNFL